MRSLLVADVEMVETEIEPGLKVFVCPASGGMWIPLQAFLTWKETRVKETTPLPKDYVFDLPNTSKRNALICPDSGRLLNRFQVGRGLDFHIEQSPSTGSVWLDRGEWDALKSKGLHAEMNLISTPSYQRQVREEEYEKELKETFRDRIGADFGKVTEFKKWLKGHPKRRDICVFLADESIEE